LAKLLWDPREVVRKLAYSKLFETALQKQSVRFDHWTWRRIFYDLLVKVFDPLVVTPKDHDKRDPVESFTINSVPDSPQLRIDDDEDLAPEIKAVWVQQSCYTTLTAVSKLLTENFGFTHFFLAILCTYFRNLCGRKTRI